jgi:predicted enzyme related to lactoylglutathione lyase
MTAASAPAGWRVTFSVDDPDAVARRTVELGGRVVVPPCDQGPVRIAELEDPQGATFTVNRYRPASANAPGASRGS